MDISKIPDRIWLDILFEKTNYNFESLSFKILLASLRVKIKQDPKEEHNCVLALKKMINSHRNLPSLERDIQNIMKKGGIL